MTPTRLSSRAWRWGAAALFACMSAAARGAELVVLQAPVLPGDPALVGVVGVPTGAEVRFMSGADTRVEVVDGVTAWVSPTKVAHRAHVRIAGDGEVSAAELEVSYPTGVARPAVTDHAVSSGAVTLRLGGLGSVPEPARQLAVSEGEIRSARVDGDDLVLEVVPSGASAPRILAAGGLDMRDPFAVPVVAAARLRVSSELALDVEPGALVEVRVGRRALPSVRAGADGRIVQSIVLGPEDTSWEVVATDAAGNVQRTEGRFPARTAPVLLALAGAHPVRRYAWVYGWTPNGARASSPPTCVGHDSVRPDTILVDEGVWRVPMLAPAGVTARVSCTLGTTEVSARREPAETPPVHLALRAYPDALDVDFPFAQVEASIVDAQGHRVAPTGMEVARDGSPLTTTLRGDALLAEVDARGAQGDVEVVARWRAPGRDGTCEHVEGSATRTPGGTHVRVRAHGADGWPLRSVPMVFRTSDEATTEATSGGEGWVETDLGGRGAWVEVGCGRSRNRLIIDGPRLGRPDVLEARLRLALRTGRVRVIELPAPVGEVREGERVVLRAVLRDASGQPLVDAPPRWVASTGLLDTATRDGDGWVTTWTPAPDAVAGPVSVTASASGAEVTTRWYVTPRPVTGALSTSFGWAPRVLRGVQAPYVGATFTAHLAALPPMVSVRAGASLLTATAQLDNPTDSVATGVEAWFVPLEAGVVVGRREGRRSIEASLSGVLTPYRVAVRRGGTTLSGVTLSQPGVAFGVANGWRRGPSEVFVEGRYMLFTASSAVVSFEGALGGVLLSTGYRFLW